MPRSDEISIIKPSGLRKLFGSVRKIEKAMGDCIKRIIPEEVTIAKKLRGHLNLDLNNYH